MFTKASIVSIFASLAAAQLHAPVGEPAGNPITSPLNQIVPTCEDFTITWQPTTPNTVSVLLLKGPSTNVVPITTLAEGIANSGSLAWDPAFDLEATEGPNGYGIQIIDDVTGQYQYSTQFGISKGDCEVVASSSVVPTSSVVPASSTGGYPASSAEASSIPEPSSTLNAYPTPPYPTSLVTISSSVVIHSTGLPYGNGSVILPTGSMTVPSSLRPSATGNATTSRLPEATGAASAVQAGLSFAGVLAAFALVL